MTAYAGLRVLDLTTPMAIYGTRLLAGLGADVLRIEPHDPDEVRTRAPIYQPLDKDIDPAHLFHNGSLYHWRFNARKRSIALDLTAKSGLAKLQELAATADILIESLGVGILDSYGLGYRDLAAINPALVVTSVTPFGLTGPRAHWQGADIVGAAMSGIMAIYGLPGGKPYHPAQEQAFHQTGLIAAIGSLVALRDRDRTGLGQQVDVSMQEAMAIVPEGGLGFADIEGKPRGRRGNTSMDGTPTLFRCADGWVAGVFGSRWNERIEWLETAGKLSRAEAERWRDESYRKDHGAQELNRLTTELVATLPKETVYREAQRRRMAISPVRRISDLFADRQLLDREFFQPLPTPFPGVAPLDAGAPVKLSKTPFRFDEPAPDLDDYGGAEWLQPPRQTPEQQPSRKELPLAGIRVLDFTVQGAGPVATRLLACFGADVIKVETPNHLDGARILLHPRPDGNMSPNVNGIFNNFGVNKRGINIQVDTPAGRQVILDLVRTCDVVVDNFGRDPFPRWNLDADTLIAEQPDLIIARSSVMGRTGPDRDFIGFGYGVAAAAGLTALTGFPDDPPLGAGALPDFTSNPHHLVLGILAALEHRRKTGEGQIVDLSQVESTASFLGTAFLDYAINGVDSEQSQNQSPHYILHGAFPCKGTDQWCVIAVKAAQRSELCTAAGRPNWLNDDYWTLQNGSPVTDEALAALVSEWTAGWDKFELAEHLQHFGVAAAPVVSTFELLHQDEHLKQRGYYRWLEHPEAGLRAHDGPPFLLSRHTSGPSAPAPLLGQHTEEVLREVLGYGEEKINEFFVAGAIG